MNNGTLITSGPRPAVRLERHLPDSPSVVWQAITDREQLRSWFPCDVVVAGGEWKVGAPITFTFPPEVIDMTLTGEVLEMAEPNVLAFTWGEEVLRFELSPDARGGTRFVLINELAPGAAARNAAGWEMCLDRLEGREHGPDSWQSLFDSYAAAFEPAIGRQDGPPEGYKH